MTRGRRSLLRLVAAFSLTCGGIATFDAGCSTFAEEPADAAGGGEGGDEGVGGEAGVDAPTTADGDGPLVPTVFAEVGAEPILDVAVNDSAVFWLTTPDPLSAVGHVYGCSRTGACTAPKALANPESQPGNLAAAGDKAFASELFQGAAARIFRVGSDLATSTVPEISGHPQATNLQLLGADLVYRARQEPAPDAGTTFTGTIFRFDGVARSEIGRYAGDGRYNFHWVAATSSQLVLMNTTQLGTCPIGACPQMTLAGVDVREPRGVVSDGTDIYWSSDRDGVVYECEPSVSLGCAVKTSILSQEALKHEAPRSLAVHSGYLVVTTDKGSVFSCQLASCEATVQQRATDWFSPPLRYLTAGRSVAVDASHIYYAAQAPGGSGFAIMKVARRAP